MEVPNWEVPVQRVYNHLYQENPVKKHALTPYYAKKESSQTEKNFVAFLEERTADIEWWYKNGECNKEDFGITYIDSTGKLRGFFVDYVIYLPDGTIALFDTKTLDSDREFVAKHNALYHYIVRQNENGPRMIGGVIVPKGENDTGKPIWRFPPGTIENAIDASGWLIFEPKNFK